MKWLHTLLQWYWKNQKLPHSLRCRQRTWMLMFTLGCRGRSGLHSAHITWSQTRRLCYNNVEAGEDYGLVTFNRTVISGQVVRSNICIWPFTSQLSFPLHSFYPNRSFTTNGLQMPTETASLDRLAKGKWNSLFEFPYLMLPCERVAHPLINIYSFLFLLILDVFPFSLLRVCNLSVLRRSINVPMLFKLRTLAPILLLPMRKWALL